MNITVGVTIDFGVNFFPGNELNQGYLIDFFQTALLHFRSEADATFQARMKSARAGNTESQGAPMPW